MTEEVTPIEDQKQELYFLDLDEGQFGTIIFLSSASANMKDFVSGEHIHAEMKRMIDSGNYHTVQQALAWIRNQRNLVNQLSSSTSFAMNLLSQVEDLVVDKLLGVVTGQDAVIEK